MLDEMVIKELRDAASSMGYDDAYSAMNGHATHEPLNENQHVNGVIDKILSYFYDEDEVKTIFDEAMKGFTAAWETAFGCEYERLLSEYDRLVF